MPTYTVEIDGKRYKIAGDRPPTEQEARDAVGAYSAADEPVSDLPGGGWDQAAADRTVRGPVSRFFEPIVGAARGMVWDAPAAAARGLGRLTDATEALGRGDTQPMVDVGSDLVHAVGDPMVAQARRGGEAWERGDYVEGAGRGAAALLPVIGPAAADVADTATEGNVAGALGKAVMLGAPFARAPKFADKLAALMKNRAAARIFDVMKPTTARTPATEKVAWEVVNGTPGRETAGGIGVGNRTTLARRALARKAAAGQEVEALQGIDTPVNPSSISERLRAEAAKRETLPPERTEVQPRDTGLLDANGDPIVDLEEVTIQGQPVSKNPALVSALRSQAKDLEDLAAQYPDGKIPAGELFKQRAVTNERIGDKAYEKLPGQTTAPHPKADKAFTKATSDFLHDPQFGENGLGGSAIIDHENHVWSKAATNLENSRIRDLVGRKFDGVKNLLMGRLAGVAMGGATGLYASGGSHLAGVTGALIGATLGENAYWGSLRAQTYKDIANALKIGDVDTAASIIQRTAATYAIDKATKDRERNRKAQRALRNEAEGVVTP